jgi:hypothetical protein
MLVPISNLCLENKLSLLKFLCFFSHLPHAFEMIRSQISKGYFQLRHFLLIICWCYQSTLCGIVYNKDGGDEENDSKNVLVMIIMVFIVMLTLIIIIMMMMIIIIIMVIKLPAFISYTVILKL